MRAQLAQQCFEMAKEETKICEKLVHEQHLQQQVCLTNLIFRQNISQFKKFLNLFLLK